VFRFKYFSFILNLFFIISAINYSPTLLAYPLQEDNIQHEHDGYIIQFYTKKEMEQFAYNLKTLKSDSLQVETHQELNAVTVSDIQVVNSFVELISHKIKHIEPNYIYSQFESIPNSGEDHYNRQWGLKTIKAEEAWEIEKGSKEVIVAVVDSGVDIYHEDLKDNIWINEAEKSGEPGVDDDNNGFIDDIYGHDFAYKDGIPEDGTGHGTHCAGVIGASHSNNLGIKGVNKNVRIMPLKFLSARGKGSLVNGAKAIKYAVDNGAHIISNSWGADAYSDILKEMITYAEERGVILVAAAGNYSTSNFFYPASYENKNVVSVAATDINDKMAEFSNFGVPHVDLSAPGVDIFSTFKDNSYKSLNGTSMATPFVAGAFALLISNKMKQNEAYQMDELIEQVLKTTDHVPSLENSVITAGRLNIYNMLNNIRPTRPGFPKEELWTRVDQKIESPHPYPSDSTLEYPVKVPEGSKFMRFHFKSFYLENRVDKVEIIVKDRKLTYTGLMGHNIMTNFITVYDTDEVVIKLISDKSITFNGFVIDYFEYQ
jgi:subtilisin family serine protease